MNIGFIGLGNMGAEMARRLLKAGHKVKGWNRTPAKAQALVKEGLSLCSSPAEAARDAAVVVTMVSDDEAAETVTFGPGGLGEGLDPHATHVSMSTISPSLSASLAQRHLVKGQGYLAAPVFGRPEAAREGKLFVAAAGPLAALKACEPLFSAIGQRTFIVGDKPPQANVAKLCGNFLLASMIESLGEAVALGRGHGIEPQALVELLTGSLFPAPAIKSYAGMIARQEYRPASFSLKLGLKDVRLADEAAEERGVDMPIAELIRRRMEAQISAGHGDDDWAALGALAGRPGRA